MICGRFITGIPQGVFDVAGVENHRARADPLPFTIHQHFDRAFLDDDEFLLRMLVRRVGSFTGIERGDMALEHFQCGRGLLEKLSRETCFGGFGLDRIPVNSSRPHDGFWGLGEDDKTGGGQRREQDEREFLSCEHGNSMHAGMLYSEAS